MTSPGNSTPAVPSRYQRLPLGISAHHSVRPSLHCRAMRRVRPSLHCWAMRSVRPSLHCWAMRSVRPSLHCRAIRRVRPALHCRAGLWCRAMRWWVRRVHPSLHFHARAAACRQRTRSRSPWLAGRVYRARDGSGQPRVATSPRISYGVCHVWIYIIRRLPCGVTTVCG